MFYSYFNRHLQELQIESFNKFQQARAITNKKKENPTFPARFFPLIYSVTSSFFNSSNIACASAFMMARYFPASSNNFVYVSVLSTYASCAASSNSCGKIFLAKIWRPSVFAALLSFLLFFNFSCNAVITTLSPSVKFPTYYWLIFSMTCSSGLRVSVIFTGFFNLAGS